MERKLRDWRNPSSAAGTVFSCRVAVAGALGLGSVSSMLWPSVVLSHLLPLTDECIRLAQDLRYPQDHFPPSHHLPSPFFFCPACCHPSLILEWCEAKLNRNGFIPLFSLRKNPSPRFWQVHETKKVLGGCAQAGTALGVSAWTCRLDLDQRQQAGPWFRNHFPKPSPGRSQMCLSLHHQWVSRGEWPSCQPSLGLLLFQDFLVFALKVSSLLISQLYFRQRCCSTSGTGPSSLLCSLLIPEGTASLGDTAQQQNLP